MITGQQIEKVWKEPIPAIKKLNWHQPFKNGLTKVINVIITGYRIERKRLKVYYDYRSPTTGKVLHGVDVANQFKIKKDA